eukprot:CAMPEP_0184021730 /NCGR_PEP_ID=MMETSP0954-20121128/10117_1 /TAXON_ID=627963 /ORGANISM="Aplanochytrium sp, Strain PBS07" /LENGTH=889 /DNA_ID=CAMNT_0026303835 /DNA_START=175 /DNA_END=2844 /DNA_ORIENTATION=+
MLDHLFQSIKDSLESQAKCKAAVKRNETTAEKFEPSVHLLKALRSVTLKDVKNCMPYAINHKCTSLLVQKTTHVVFLVCWKSGETVTHLHPGNEYVKVLQGSLQASHGQRLTTEETMKEIGPNDDTLVSLDVGELWHSSVMGKSYTFQSPVSSQDSSLDTVDSATISLHIRVSPSPGILAPCSCETRPWVLCNKLETSVSEREKLSKVGSQSPVSIGIDQPKEKNLCYTNFRNLIKTLHERVEPLSPGKFHSQGHIEEISELLKSVRLNSKEYGRYLRFRDDHYTRNLVGYDVPEGDGDRPKFTVLLLCWDKGQMSPIHDHAGSSCWVKVLVGRLREVRYRTLNDKDTTQDHTNVEVIRDLTAGAEEVCYINDTQGIHSMGNASSDQVCVSLHIYAPPYVLCKLFDESSGAVTVGSMAAATTPCNPFASIASPNVDCTSISNGYKGLLGITGFMNCLRDLKAHQFQGLDQSDAPGELLSRLYLKEREWKEFVHFDTYRYQRSLVAFNSQFSLILMTWNTGQTTPIHDHGDQPGGCWVKVLSGKLCLRTYSGDKNDPTLKSEYEFKEGDMVRGEEDEVDLFSGLHLLGNQGDTPAVSLHLFSPPILDFKYQDGCGNEKEIPLVHSATSLMDHYNHMTNVHFKERRQKNRVSFADDASMEEKAASVETGADSGSAQDDLVMEDILADTVHYSNLYEFTRYARKFVFSRNNELTSTERFRIVSQIFSKFEFQDGEWKPYYVHAKSMNMPANSDEVPSGSSCIRAKQSRDNLSVSSFGSSASSYFDEDNLFVSALLARGENFTLRLICWKPGFSQTPQSQQGCTCSWIKILKGHIDETQYHTNPFARGNVQEIVHNVTLGAHGSVTYLGPTIVFSLENSYDKPCYALSLEYYS